MKICKKCGKNKTEIEFAVKSGSYRHDRCKECNAQSRRERYAKQAIKPRGPINRAKDGFKVCTKCKLSKSVERFYKSRAGYFGRCKDCKNEEKRETVKFIQQLKEVPCADCKVQYPYYVMDFDHLNAEEKRDCIAQLKWSSPKAVFDEIKKCEIVCSNCHRKRTFVREQTKHSGDLL